MLEHPTEKIILDRICSEINRILSEKWTAFIKAVFNDQNLKII
jgi:hypothetical protein